MAASSQAYRNAKSFLIARDFEAAVELLSTLNEPSPQEMCLLADAYMLSGSREGDEKAAEAAYRNAIQLYSLHHADHSQPTMVYRLWAAAAYNVGDEEELIQAKKAGLRQGNDVQLIFFHYLLKRDLNAPESEREQLVDQILALAPEDFNGLTLKSSFLTRRREWKKAWEHQMMALRSPSERQRNHSGFPVHLIRGALLSLIQGHEWEPWLTWAQDVGPQHVWVKAAERLFASETKKQQVERAKELLSGEADFEGQSFDEWLGAVPAVQPVILEEPEEAEEKQVEQVPYSQDHIETMGPGDEREDCGADIGEGYQEDGEKRGSRG
jgi:hypothetical protein